MYIRNIIFLFLFILPLSAQTITWQEQTTQYALPRGVKLFSGTRTSPALKMWYLEVNMNEPTIAIKPYTTPAGKEGLTSFYPRYNFIAAINGGYFDLASNSMFSAVVQPGNLIAKNINSVVRDSKTYLVTRTLFSFTETRKPAVDWIYHFGTRPQDVFSYANPNPNVVGTPGPAPSQPGGKQMFELFTGIGGGPMLVKNGQIKITYNEEVFWGSGVGLDNRDPRTGVGFTADNKIILAVADGRQTASDGLSLPEFAQFFIDRGCTDAMNLDGGGSSQMAVRGTLINMPEGGVTQRPLPAILAVVKSDSIPFLPPVYFDKRQDTGDRGVFLIGSSWFESTLPGFYGTTPTWLAPAGNGTEYATFVLPVPRAGRYRVDAWWTATTNRASNTPFVIKHEWGTDTVRMNQSINGSKWNSLGEFNFTGDTANTVTIVNLCEAGKYVAADALRLISFDSTFTTEVRPEFSQVPRSLALQQNYPNPFNPETTITFSVPKNEYIKLAVYNILGRHIATLREGFTEAGEHRENFNASALASGMYVYRLETGSGSISKKLIVLR